MREPTLRKKIIFNAAKNVVNSSISREGSFLPALQNSENSSTLQYRHKAKQFSHDFRNMSPSFGLGPLARQKGVRVTNRSEGKKQLMLVAQSISRTRQSSIERKDYYNSLRYNKGDFQSPGRNAISIMIENQQKAHIQKFASLGQF